MRLMNFAKLFALTMIIGLVSTGAFAGKDHKHGPGGHSHGTTKALNAQEAKDAAKEVVKKLAETGKLPKSWLKVNATSATQKKFKESTEWVVVFDNPAGAAGKKKLYVFLTLSGDYLGANHTGN